MIGAGWEGGRIPCGESNSGAAVVVEVVVVVVEGRLTTGAGDSGRN